MLKKRSSKKKYLLIGLVVLLAVGGIFAYTQTLNGNDNDRDSVNYSPPTKEEQEASNTQKEKNIEREQIDTNNQTIKNAEVVLVDANQYNDTVEVRTYIANIYEDGGTCTVTFTKDGQTITRNNKGFKDATTTQCEPFVIPRSTFSEAGDWQLKVSYASDSSAGESSQTVSIK